MSTNAEIDEANAKLEGAAVGRVAIQIVTPYIKNEIEVLLEMNLRRFRDGQLTERLALDAFAQMAALDKILKDVDRQVRNSELAMDSIHGTTEEEL